MLVFLEHHHAGALAHHEAVAVAVIGARGAGRLVVEGGAQRAAGGEAGERQAADRRFGAAGHHHVGIAEGDEACGIADGVGAGGAGRDHRVVRPLEAVGDGDIAAGKIDQAARNEERRDAARALVAEDEGGFSDAVDSADAGADEDPRGVLLVRGLWMPAGIVEGLLGGAHGEDDELVDLALLLRLHPVIGIEGAGALPRDLAGDLGGDVGHVEALDLGGPALALDQPRPGFLDTAAERGQQPHAGHNHPPHHHATPFPPR